MMELIENKPNLLDIIGRFTSQKITVIGDLMLDRYLWCSVDRISPEAPVPVANVEKETFVPGGAANVAFNAKALGAETTLIGCVGDDHYGDVLKDKLLNQNINCDGIFTVKGRMTTVKSRVVCGVQQLLRIDREEQNKIDAEIENKLLDIIKHTAGSSVIILSDYAKGLLSKTLARNIIAWSMQNNIKTLADPTPNSYKFFNDAFLIKPNKKEAELMSGISIAPDLSNLSSVGGVIAEQTNSKVLITLGKDGMALFENNQIKLIPTTTRHVYDVSGAGDTTIAAISTAISAGASLEEAAIIGNLCAGIVVSKLGTAVCELKELQDSLQY